MRQRARMMGKQSFQLAQATRARQLAHDHRDQMAPGLKRPLRAAGVMALCSPLEPPARHRFQQLAKHRRLVLHGLGLSELHSTAFSTNTVESKPCTSSTDALAGHQWVKPG